MQIFFLFESFVSDHHSRTFETLYVTERPDKLRMCLGKSNVPYYKS